jgi:hypothetical protein
MSMNAATREALYNSYRALGNSLRQKHAERGEAARTLKRIDTDITYLEQQRKEIADHAATSGEDFEAAEQEQAMIAAVGREQYDPMGSGTTSW